MPDEQDMLLTQWLYDPNSKPAKELSKHDQNMIQLGWDAALKHRLDRPDRDELAELIWMDGIPNDAGWKSTWYYKHKEGRPYKIADQILAFFPSKEEISKQEKERILTIVKDLFRGMVFASQRALTGGEVYKAILQALKGEK